MTIEGLMSDAKYAYRAIWGWLTDSTNTAQPASSVKLEPCAHPVLLGNHSASVNALPCANCGALVDMDYFIATHPHFYIVAVAE